MKKRETKSPEKYLIEAIELVQKVAVRNEALHLTHCFTDSPGQSAVVTAFIVCPDSVAKIIHKQLDEVIQRVLHDHGLRNITTSASIQ